MHKCSDAGGFKAGFSAVVLICVAVKGVLTTLNTCP